VLAYGLCGQATAGLVARGAPLVIPRAHDCITLFLGSRERYNEQFLSQPGTYWYTLDYLERRQDSATSLSLGLGSDTDLQAVYEEYVQKYGQDNADYLMEVMGAWQKHYQRAVYIDLGSVMAVSLSRKAAEASRRGWAFERMAGDLVLIRRLIQGEWGDGETGDFLILQPGQAMRMTYDENIIGCREVSHA
jgi:hypothetical protein